MLNDQLADCEPSKEKAVVDDDEEDVGAGDQRTLSSLRNVSSGMVGDGDWKTEVARPRIFVNR